MKKIVFSSLALLLFGIICSAQQREYDIKDASIITSFRDQKIEYKFKSLDNLNDELTNIIEDLGLEKSERSSENCKIMVELRLEIEIGATAVSISERIVTECDGKAPAEAIRMLKGIVTATIDKEIVKSDG